MITEKKEYKSKSNCTKKTKDLKEHIAYTRAKKTK